jgi:Nucleotidyl transferase AbiEii toxin, Type IV TA system
MHGETLRSAQAALLKKLGGPATERGFYLAGGTALAIHLGHRRSDDFDWFTQAPILNPEDLGARLRGQGFTLGEQQIMPGTLHAVIDGLHVSFLEYRYGLLKSLVAWPDYECQLAAVEDICCMKLAAIADRGAKKDFVDVHAIATTTELSLSQMLRLYCEKYETAEVATVIYALSYFDDAEQDPMPEMLLGISWPEVKEEVSSWVADYR